MTAAHPELTQQALKKMLAIWCGRPTYQKALMRGGPRVDLHGLPVGEVTPEQMAHAQERLKVLSERAKERKEAATKPVEARTAVTYALDTPAPLQPKVSKAPVRIPSRPILTLKRRAGT